MKKPIFAKLFLLVIIVASVAGCRDIFLEEVEVNDQPEVLKSTVMVTSDEMLAYYKQQMPEATVILQHESPVLKSGGNFKPNYYFKLASIEHSSNTSMVVVLRNKYKVNGQTGYKPMSYIVMELPETMMQENLKRIEFLRTPYINDNVPDYQDMEWMPVETPKIKEKITIADKTFYHAVKIPLGTEDNDWLLIKIQTNETFGSRWTNYGTRQAAHGVSQGYLGFGNEGEIVETN